MVLLQSTSFLHCSCPPGRVGHKANFIEFIPAIGKMWAKFSIFFFVFFFFLKGSTEAKFFFSHTLQNLLLIASTYTLIALKIWY